MAAMASRLMTAFSQPAVPKDAKPVRFGVLGASNIGPMALFDPAKSHPEIVIQAVAARDASKAAAYAAKHKIPDVKGSYQELLNDPNIDVIYIPLPNAYHFEWAVRSVRAGKHVLIEKPIVSNAEEAEALFGMPELARPNGPIVMEAFHNRFHPSFQYFKTLVEGADIEKIHAKCMLPWWMTGKDQIYFKTELGGGNFMSIGTYSTGILRSLIGAEPIECIACEVDTWPDENLKTADTKMKATWRFPNGAIGIAESTLRGPTIWEPSSVVVTNKEVTVPDANLPAGQVKTVKRIQTLHGFLFAVVWHRIDIKDTYTIYHGDRVVKSWTESSTKKAYTFEEAGGKLAHLPGKPDWISYRHMLEQFVNKVKGRETQSWISGQDSINQMRAIDMAYEKSGLGKRPTRTLKVE